VKHKRSSHTGQNSILNRFSSFWKKVRCIYNNRSNTTLNRFDEFGLCPFYKQDIRRRSFLFFEEQHTFAEVLLLNR